MPPVQVEYDDGKGGRATKRFTDAYAARRFYAGKLKEGRNPAVRGTDTQTPFHRSPDMPRQIRKVTAEEARIFTTSEEANKNKPDRPNWKCFKVTSPAGEIRFTWAPDRFAATLRSALVDGYVAADPAKIPSKEAVQTMLQMLPADERQALVSQFGGGGKKK
jgi:hypothetical protein